MLWIAVFFASCFAQQPLDVVIIPHSHCDAGYRETFLGYFRDKVNLTLTSVVTLLAKDPSKSFVWEEVSYFQLWWDQQPASVRATVQRLAKSGQLEFIGGGWVMHDEADGTMAQQLNQMSRGLQWLEENLGIRPHIQWQIDPFGHSSTNGVIHSMLGFDAIVLNRMDANLKTQFKATKEMEFIWQPNSLLNHTADIFVHFLDSHYGPPPIPSGGDVKTRATWLAECARARAEWFRTPVLLIPVGGDFDFTDAPAEFGQWDPLLDYINNEHSGIFANLTFRYGTLNDYFSTVKTLAQEKHITFPTKSDIDFFPYVACNCDDNVCIDKYGHVPCGTPDAFWTGFYTSKPGQKYLSSQQDVGLRTAEILYSLRRMFNTQPDPPVISDNWWESLDYARFQSALYQHHDAITGTCFEHCTVSVTECDCYGDYTKRLSQAMNLTDVLISQLLETILNTSDTPSSLPSLGTSFNQDFQNLIKNNQSLVVVVVNDLGWERTNELISYGPLLGRVQANIKVTRASEMSNEITYQFVYDPLRDTTTLYFESVTLAPLSITTFFIEPIQKATADGPKASEVNFLPDDNFSNGIVGLSFSNGRVTAFLAGNAPIPMSLDYLRYVERLPQDGNIFTGSNVYSFTPKGPPVSLYPSPPPSLVSVANGPLVWEVQQTVNSYVSHTYRILKNSSLLINQVRIGEIPQDVSSSISLRFTPTVNNKGRFFTDTNSYSRMSRMQNNSRPVQGNMYPTSGKFSVVDEAAGRSFHLLPSRAVGVTSANGSMEVLLHRRILDIRDSRGNDSAIIDEPVVLMFQQGPDAHSAATVESVKRSSPPTVRSAAIASVNQWRSVFEDEISAMPSPLPLDVHLLDLKALSNATQCPNGMRLWRVSGESGDPARTIPLQTIFSSELQLLRKFSLDYQLPIEELRPHLDKQDVDTAVLPARGSIEAFVFNFFI